MQTAKLFIICAVTIMIGLTAVFAQSTVNRYKVKSGIVEYKITGTQSGRETLYFDKFGKREATYSNTKISFGGFSQETNTMALLKGKYQYNIDLDKKTGNKIDNPFLQQMNQSAAEQGKDLTDAGEEMMKQMGGKKIGTEMFLGKKCDVWEIKQMSTKVWVYKGIALKTESNMAGMKMTKVATSFQENVKIPEIKFTIPKDVKMTDAGNPMDMLKKMQQQR